VVVVVVVVVDGGGGCACVRACARVGWLEGSGDEIRCGRWRRRWWTAVRVEECVVGVGWVCHRGVVASGGGCWWCWWRRRVCASG